MFLGTDTKYFSASRTDQEMENGRRSEVVVNEEPFLEPPVVIEGWISHGHGVDIVMYI